MPSAATLDKPRTSLRLLIVGLLDRQFGIVRNEFPSLDLEHFTADRISQISNAMNRADRVLVITKFISHKAFAHVDRAKIAYFTGMDSLRQRLANYAAETVFAESNVITADFRKEAKDMAAPMLDYTQIMYAQPGDVLTYIRPNGIEAHAFSHNLRSARAYYSTTHGIKTSQEISGGRALVTILSKPQAPIATPILDQAEALFGDDDVTFRLPNVQEQARDFWREVYLQSFRQAPYLPASHHAEIATVAVAGWLSSFGEMEEN